MRMSTMFGLAVLLMLLNPAEAWAYIDPATGSYSFQLLLAGGLAGFYTLRRYWANVAMFVRTLLGRAGDHGGVNGANGVD
jgi:hypothetical protein